MAASHSIHTLSYVFDNLKEPYDDSVNDTKENADPRPLQPVSDRLRR